MYIDNLICNLQQLEDNLILKKDYSEEMEMLNDLKGDIKALSGHQSTPRYKIQQANEIVDHILNLIEWMLEEMHTK